MRARYVHSASEFTLVLENTHLFSCRAMHKDGNLVCVCVRVRVCVWVCVCVCVATFCTNTGCVDKAPFCAKGYPYWFGVLWICWRNHRHDFLGPTTKVFTLWEGKRWRNHRLAFLVHPTSNFILRIEKTPLRLRVLNHSPDVIKENMTTTSTEPRSPEQRVSMTNRKKRIPDQPRGVFFHL